MIKWIKNEYGYDARISYTDNNLFGTETLTITKNLRIVKNDNGLFYLLILNTVTDSTGKITSTDSKYKQSNFYNGDLLRNIKEDIQNAVNAGEYSKIR